MSSSSSSRLVGEREITSICSVASSSLLALTSYNEGGKETLDRDSIQ